MKSRLKIIFVLLILPILGSAQQPAGTLNVKTDGTAIGNGLVDDAAAIQAVIESADTQNKNIYFPPGTYRIGSDITTRQGVSLLGDHAGLSIIESEPGTVRYVGNQTWSSPSGSIDVEDLIFINVQADWYGSESKRKYIDVRRCLFIGEDPAFANTTSSSFFHINLGHTVDSVVEDCIFLRQSSSMGGSVYGYQTVRQVYRRNVWGVHLDRLQWLETQWTGYTAWTDLLPKLGILRSKFNLSADQGHFRRGIKVNGCDGSRIEHNIFNGSPYTSVTPVNRDHVIYAHGGYTDLEVLSNWMRGWPSAPNGGVKMRNSHGTTTAIANYFVNTPILQYAYDNDPVHPIYENAILHRNHMEIYQNFSDGRLGISFWETIDGIPSQTNNEYSANMFECPKSYPYCINLTNGDLTGHTAYDSNVFLSDGSPVTTAGDLVLVPGGPDSSRYSAYDSYQIPMLSIPVYTTHPEFTTNLINLGSVLPDQMVTGSVADLASDADGESLEFMKMDGPDWLTVNLDGTYSGTPSLADVGINAFTIRAADNKDGYGATTLQVNVNADSTTLTFNPIHDTHVFHGDTNANYGANTALLTRSDKYESAYNAFLMFDVDVGGQVITSAKLNVYCEHNPTITTLHEVSDTSWSEDTMTWSNQPGMDAVIESKSTGSNVWEEFVVSPVVRSDGKVAFALTSNEASYSRIVSKEGAHPPVLEVVVAANSNDWDGDGMPNDWELAYFGGETNGVATGHGDADGMDNLSEYIAGYDPTNSESFFAATNSMSPAGFVISWNAISNREYGIWHGGSLTHSFTNLQSGILFPQNSFTDTAHSAETKGFYKVDVQLIE